MASKEKKYFDKLLIEGYIYEEIFESQRTDYPVDVTNSILLYYHETYRILPFDSDFKSKQIILSNQNNLASNPPDANHHHYVLGGATAEEAVWRLNVCDRDNSI